MSQQETKPCVLVTNVKGNINQQDMEKITSQVTALVDEWQSSGKIMWSGSFNESYSMTIFESTENKSQEFFKKYEDICSKVLNSYLYTWDEIPLLSVLSK